MKNISSSKFILLILFVIILSACDEDAVIIPMAGATVQSQINQVESNFDSGGVIAITRSIDGTTDIGVLGKSENDVPISEGMSMGIGSNTKTFTATLIFKLIEGGQLNLSDKLVDIMPSVVSGKVNGDITIQQLLTHSSGIDDPLNRNDKLINSVFENPSKGYSLADYLALLSDPAFAPGTKHSYSNTNYMLLGAIIEQLSGVKYHEYLRESILDPLGMTSTFVMGRETPTNSIAYSWYEGNSLKDFDRTGIESLSWSAGSIFSSVEDMAIWYHALFSGLVISESSIKEMLTTNEGDLGELNLFGSGIFQTNYKGDELYFHSGETIAYNSIAMFNKTTGDLVITMVNQIDDDASGIAYRLLDSMLL